MSQDEVFSFSIAFSALQDTVRPKNATLGIAPDGTDTARSPPQRLEDAVNVPSKDLHRAVRDVASEISLLSRLTNTIRRASKESSNIKATKLYRIRDDDGNDAEPTLEEIFSNYICGRFPSISDGLRQRLASSMVLRRRRILYRRSRYWSSPIKPAKTMSQPRIDFPQPQQQAGTTIEPTKLTETSTMDSLPEKSIVKSVAFSATTLAADDYKRASTPSVISATRTVALGNHEEIVFPPPPNGRIRRKYKTLLKLRQGRVVPEPKALDDLFGGGSNKPTLDPGMNIRTNEEIWDGCNKAIAEVTCPFCLYALPSLSVGNEKKWR